MLGRIRRRLTMGYVSILALILVLFGAIVLFSFWQRVTAQQNELLEQRASGIAKGNYDTKNVQFLEEGGKYGLVLIGSDGHVAESTFAASSLGLPSVELARLTLESGKTVSDTTERANGDVRVASAPVFGPGGAVVGAVQVARSPRVVQEIVASLLLVLIPVGIGALLLSAVGGLYMSRRAMRPAETAFERQRAFIADASHELKTPLTLIRADAEVLSRGLTDPDRKELADDLILETDRMNALLSDLLTLARLDAGKLAIGREPFDLAGVIAETSERFAARAEAEGKRLEVHLGEGKIPARGDADRTAQILVALLDNALRYTPPGGLITVQGRAPDGRVEASVSDTGPGIAPEHLGRIFDRFYRAEEARTRVPSGGGTGLGLAIARDLARAQGGDLSAGNAKRGEAGGGASFTLALPAGS